MQSGFLHHDNGDLTPINRPRLTWSAARTAAPLLAFGIVGRDEFDQRRPWNDFVHLLQELALAGFLGAQIEVQCGLLHAMYFIANGRICQHISAGVIQSFLSKVIVYARDHFNPHIFS